ncbi:DNA-binding transcriptional regulator YhcF, GntR family [Microbacterium sp. ru370.1]|uniref:GntR family transcriptional regulator n=1 Tax=unclassified Microbacterium TaxID=2609290 RepID=UPI00087E7747|nr:MULTISPECIES: GntR family transcriptional regulator [unclassified Microbacterium]SDO29072.1 DNA-binding transcriptional regulator YhcF, GntR family [Microbacterium sp. ru370.1]SIT75441.1 DNA-binding transcriptional regulator YhcF, GntR family [Microbacterium sp. RU1D]
MKFSLDAASPTPPYEQVRAQVIAAIDDGSLVAGTRLPPVRTLAAELNLAANTVARAYKELEEAGYVETRGRAGTIVRGGDAAASRAAQAAKTYVDTVRSLGVSSADAVALVRAAFGEG